MDQPSGTSTAASASAAASSSAAQQAAATAAATLRHRENHRIATDILDDLSSRFIINVPAEERSDFIRICFQIELAHWFYLDFYCSAADTRLVPCGIKQFAYHIFHHIPFLSEHLPRLTDIMTEFKNYKMSVPTYGAILMTADRQRVLLVQSFLAKSSWGFPKGKVNEHEDPLHCAVREVYEETGYNCQPLIRPDVYIECVLNYQYTRLYIVPDVPEATAFAPRTRGEIKACTWFQLDLLPTHKMDPVCKERLGINANSFFMIMPFVKRLKRWVVLEQRAAGGGRASVGGKLVGGGDGRDGKQQQQQQQQHQQQSQQQLLQQQQQRRQRHKSLGDLEASRRMTPNMMSGGGGGGGRQQQQPAQTSNPGRTNAATAATTATSTAAAAATRAQRNGDRRRENGNCKTPTIAATAPTTTTTTSTNNQQQRQQQQQPQQQQPAPTISQHEARAIRIANAEAEERLQQLVAMRENEHRMNSIEDFLDTKYEQALLLIRAEEDQWQLERQQEEQQRQQQSPSTVAATITSPPRRPPIGVFLGAINADPAVQRWRQFQFTMRPEMLAPWSVASG